MINRILKDWFGIFGIEYDIQYNKNRVDYLEHRLKTLEEEIQKLKHPGPTHQERVLGALLKYLEVGIKLEQEPDPSRMPEPTPTVEVMKLYKL